MSDQTVFLLTKSVEIAKERSAFRKEIEELKRERELFLDTIKKQKALIRMFQDQLLERTQFQEDELPALLRRQI